MVDLEDTAALVCGSCPRKLAASFQLWPPYFAKIGVSKVLIDKNFKV